MFWPPAVSGSLSMTVAGPVRTYGSVPIPVVRSPLPIGRKTFVQVSPTYRGPGMVYAGPGLVVGVTPGAVIRRNTIRYFGSTYRGPAIVDTQASPPLQRQPVYPWIDPAYEIPGGRTQRFPPLLPLSPPIELSDMTPYKGQGLGAVWVPPISL